MPADRPITGAEVFCHASGIHFAGLLKGSQTYQPFPIEILGREAARLVVGRHSGLKVIQHALSQAGLTLKPEKVEDLLAAVRAEALRTKAVLPLGRLVQLYHQALA